MQDVSYPSFGNQFVYLCLSLLSSLPNIFVSISDTAPVNSFPRSTSLQGNSSQWVFDLAATKWEKWIGSEGAKQVREVSGCYSVLHPTVKGAGEAKLRVISINTQYWYKQNCTSRFSFRETRNGRASTDVLFCA